MRSKNSGRMLEDPQTKQKYIAYHRDQKDIPKGKIAVVAVIEKPTLFPDIVETEVAKKLISIAGLKIIGFID